MSIIDSHLQSGSKTVAVARAKAMSDNTFQRELSVLGPGLADGAVKAAQETWSNAKTFVSDFEKNPLSATGNYLGDHAKDFAAGALISALAPSKLVTGAIMAWSMKGFVIPTVEAARDAADTKANTKLIESNYANAIGAQGSAMLSSLPMTIAGGMLGRSATNVVFGKGNGLVDVATGKVSFTDMKENVSNFADSFHQLQTKALITDVDDTLIPLKPYLANSLRTNVSMLSSQMHLPEEQVIRDLGPERMHPWFLEQSPLARKFNGTPQEFQTQIVEPFWQNDSAELAKLEPFPGVVDTLNELHARGVKVIAQTNAPMPWAIKRLTGSGLDSHIDSLYAMESPEPSVSDVGSTTALENGRAITNETMNTPNGIGSIHQQPQGLQKPSVDGLDSVLKTEHLKPSEVISVGDNLPGDGAAPQFLGAKFLWARYSKDALDPADKAFLRRFKPRQDAVETEAPPLEKGSLTSVPSLQNYHDIMSHLEYAPNWTSVKSTLAPGLNGAWPLGYNTFRLEAPPLSSVSSSDAHRTTGENPRKDWA